MEKFINNKRILIMDKDSSMSSQHDFIITDLENVSQIILNKSVAPEIAKFIVENMGAYGESEKNRKNINDILLICQIRNIIYIKQDLINTLNKFRISINDIEKDEFYSMDDIPENGILNQQIFNLLNSIKTILLQINLNDNAISKLNDRGIYIENGELIKISANGNSSAVSYEINNNLISIKNTSYKRERYLKSLSN